MGKKVQGSGSPYWRVSGVLNNRQRRRRSSLILCVIGNRIDVGNDWMSTLMCSGVSHAVSWYSVGNVDHTLKNSSGESARIASFTRTAFQDPDNFPSRPSRVCPAASHVLYGPVVAPVPYVEGASGNEIYEGELNFLDKQQAVGREAQPVHLEEDD